MVVIGDGRPYLVALIVPNRLQLEPLAEREGIRALRWEELLEKEDIKNLLRRRLEERMKDFAPYEQIKYFRLLPKEFSQDAGEMTPTLKVKRRLIMERYAAQIDALYALGEGQGKSAAP